MLARRWTWSSTPRSMASRRRCSAGASSAGIWNVASSSRARTMRCKSASSCVAVDDSVGWDASLLRRYSSGERSSCFRSTVSAARKASMSILASRPLMPCSRMLLSSALCSPCGSDVSAYASVGPIAPDAISCSTDGESRVPIALRRATQSGFRPNRRATAVVVRPSSSTSEQTTRASSSAVVVRPGALTASISRLCSTLRAGDSTTTGTIVAPCSRHRCTRLNPSRTSNTSFSLVSGQGATRSGSSLPCSARGGTAPGRSEL